MQKVLSTDLWKAIRTAARKARQRKAAIAYVTRDLIGFRKGDVLIVDASTRASASGETDARLLRKLSQKPMRLYHCADLHAKVLLLGQVAIIGSGNMSGSSARAMVEAAIMTDQASTIAGVDSFIEQLIQQSEELTEAQIQRLCQIKVIRRGGRGNATGVKRRKTKISQLGNRTWLIGVQELMRDPAPDEQKMIDKAKAVLGQKQEIPDEDLNWVRWTGKSRFRKECRTGDRLIQIWRSGTAKRPSIVLRAVPVLLKQSTKRWTRFYLPPTNRSEMPWGEFQRLLKGLGYDRPVSPKSKSLLEADLADAITRKWKPAAQKKFALSRADRAKITAAAKARWAKIHAAKK